MCVCFLCLIVCCWHSYFISYNVAAFEYYFFHFAYFLIHSKAVKSKQYCSCLTYHILCPSSFQWYTCRLYYTLIYSIYTTGIFSHHKQVCNLFHHLLQLKISVHKRASESIIVRWVISLVVQDFNKEISTLWSGQCNKKWWAGLAETQWDKPHPFPAVERVCGYMVFWELCTGKLLTHTWVASSDFIWQLYISCLDFDWVLAKPDFIWYW